MTGNDDERLAAWLDGALAPDQADAFERELARNPDLARRAAEWKANDAFIAGALAPVADAPIGADMLARMGLAEPAPAKVAANDNPPFWRRHALPLGGAIAASVAVILAIAVPNRQSGTDPLSLALESTPALQTARLADGRTIEPTLTVRAANGRWCREFRSGNKTSLACRNANGWTIEATAEATGPAESDNIGLAAGADTSALDGAYRRIGASDALGAQAEAELIAKGWGDR
jgi:anti-sigma factor RsiW